MLEQDISCLCFAGCAWRWPFHLGVAKTLSKEMDLSSYKLAGASSGTYTAFLLAYGLDWDEALDKLLSMHEEALTKRKVLGVVGYMSTIVRDGIDFFMERPGFDYTKANGRLHVSITKLPFFKNEIINVFHSKEDVKQAILASCYIPLYCEKPVKFRGQWCVDGGATNNRPLSKEQTTLVISSRSKDTDLGKKVLQAPVLLTGAYLPTRKSIMHAYSEGEMAADRWLRKNPMAEELLIEGDS